MSTMAGIGPSSSDFRESEIEGVYLLTRRRSSIPPPPASSFSPSMAAPMAQPRDAAPMAQPRDTAPMAQPRDASSVVYAGPSFARGGDIWEGEPWSDENRAASDGDDDDDASDIRPVSRFARRRRGIRVLGALAIVGALAGGTFVLQQPKVRHEALSFVTLGHEDAAARLGRRIAAIANALRQH
jgi:hypothetical protein